MFFQLAASSPIRWAFTRTPPPTSPPSAAGLTHSWGLTGPGSVCRWHWPSARMLFLTRCPHLPFSQVLNPYTPMSVSSFPFHPASDGFLSVIALKLGLPLESSFLLHLQRVTNWQTTSWPGGYAHLLSLLDVSVAASWVSIPLRGVLPFLLHPLPQSSWPGHHNQGQLQEARLSEHLTSGPSTPSLEASGWSTGLYWVRGPTQPHFPTLPA